MRNGRPNIELARRVARSLRLVAVTMIALCCALALAVTSIAATVPTPPTSALIMGGTFTPTPGQAEVDRNIADFINPTVNPNLLPIQGSTVSYPASAGIVPGSPTINQSVRIGVANLDAAIAAQQLADPEKPIVVFGHSQSTVVSMIEKADLEQRKARGEAVPDVTFVGIGVGNRPHGGIATYLQGVTIPIVDFSFNGPAPTDPEFGITTVDIAREYDGLADFPLYPLNLLADLNALLGVVFVHARYDEVSLDTNSPKYVPGTTTQQYGDTTYYQIPTADLPLFDLARIIGVPEALIDIVEPVAKVIVDAGYDRTIPFGEPTSLRLVPALDPAKLTTDLVAAVGTGLGNALRLIAPAVPANNGPVASVARGEDVSPGGHPAPSATAVPESNAHTEPAAQLVRSTSSARASDAAARTNSATTNDNAATNDSQAEPSKTKTSSRHSAAAASHRKFEMHATPQRSRAHERTSHPEATATEAEDDTSISSPKGATGGSEQSGTSS